MASSLGLASDRWLPVPPAGVSEGGSFVTVVCRAEGVAVVESGLAAVGHRVDVVHS